MKKSLNEMIRIHLMAKEDFNEIARNLVDEKIAELVPFLENCNVIHISSGIVNGEFTGFRIRHKKATVRISTDEIAKRFFISEEVKDASSPYWHYAVEAIDKAYDELPNRCRYFKKSVCNGALYFIS